MGTTLALATCARVGRQTAAVQTAETHSRAALIVEDDATIREALASLLEDEGFEVMTATTLARARHVLFESSHPVSVVVLDLSLADGDAEPLVDELYHAGARGPALVLLSAHAQRLIPLAMSYAVPYVTKPFDMGVLAATVSVAYEQRMQPHRPSVANSDAGARRRRIVPEDPSGSTS